MTRESQQSQLILFINNNRYFSRKESIFGKNDIIIRWFSMVQDRFLEIKTNFGNSEIIEF